MIQHSLHELEVASLAQRLGCEVVSEIVEAKADDARPLAQPVPVCAQPRKRERITLPLHPSAVGPLCDIGEDEFRMVPAQWPQDFADCRCDRRSDQLPALAEFADLPSFPVNLAPSQQTLVLPQARRHRKGKERRIIVSGCRLQPLAFIAHQLAYPLLWHVEPVLAPSWLMVEANAEHFATAE